MNRTKLAASILASVALVATPAFAKMNGFGTATTTTQGASGKLANDRNSTKSQGDTTTTTSGPKGALKNSMSTPNQTTTSTGPGKSIP